MSGASYREMLATSRDKIYLYQCSLQYLMWRILIGSDMTKPAEVDIFEGDRHCCCAYGEMSFSRFTKVADIIVISDALIAPSDF